LLNKIQRYRRGIRANRHAKRKAALIRQHGLFDSEDLVRLVRSYGVQAGSVLFVQCAYNNMYTFNGTAADVLSALKQIVGPSGTLLMPTFTSNTWETPPKTFDILKTPTYTGLVNEWFRRTPGVIRSLHPRHSICGIGPLAADILRDHDKCVRANAVDSPFDRLRYLDNAVLLTLGLPPGYISFLHWLEDIEPNKLPFAVHVAQPVARLVMDHKGVVTAVPDTDVQSRVAARLSLPLVANRLSENAMTFEIHKGVEIGVYSVKRLAAELLVLRDAGVIHYRKPIRLW
jgi:aminoglycoside 3-N-acetyltransferase